MSVEHDTAWHALARAAEAYAGSPLLRIDEQEFTYADCFAAVSDVSAGLAELGIVPGERVAVMADNRQETLWSWLGILGASAVEVPLNTSAQGQFLAAQLANSTPRALVGTADYLQRIAELRPEGVELVVSMGDAVDPALFVPGTRHVSFAELQQIGRASRRTPAPPTASSTATILYTSGTTGPSKGVMIPQRYYPVWGRRGAEYVDVQRGEVVYCAQPLFHVDARAYFLVSMLRGATAAIGARFSLSSFWDEIRRHDANVFSYIGTMLWLLYKQEPSERDRDHNVRIAGGAATPAEIHREFEQRFGIALREAYGMTESLFLAHAHADTPPGSVGRLVPELDGRLVDHLDQPVPDGEQGELVIRPREPFITAQGYWAMPQESVEATRNQWFHTGDLLRADPDGNLFFLGRTKDSIRRRGENVSAWEVEQAAMLHPDVLEAAAIAVPSPLGEDDVALLVTLRPGAALAHADLRAFVAADLPRFAVPRYIEIVGSFPKTASERVDKGKVRATGISAAAWDAEAAEENR